MPYVPFTIRKINDPLSLHVAPVLKDPTEQAPSFHIGHPGDLMVRLQRGGFRRLSDHYGLYSGGLRFSTLLGF